MNTQLASYLRHIFTAWITTAVIGLTAWFTLDEKSAATVADGFSKIAEGLLVVLAVLVPVVGRLVWAWLANVFRSGSGENGERDNGMPGGLPLIALIGTVAALMGVLPSCSPRALDGVTGSIHYRDPQTGAKAGLVFDPAAPPRARIAVPLIDAETGEQIGFADLSAPIRGTK